MTTARMRAVAFKEFELSNNLKNLMDMYEARQNKDMVIRVDRFNVAVAASRAAPSINIVMMY